MTRTIMSLVYSLIVLVSVTIHSTDGACSVVNCLVGMMRCSRKADVAGEDYQNYGCCSPYFECMRECGYEAVRYEYIY